MWEERAFREGVETMRDAALVRFERSTFGQFAGWQAAQAVRELTVRRRLPETQVSS